MSKALYLTFFFIVLLISVFLTYKLTKSSYLAVGEKNGKINAKSDLFLKFKEIYKDTNSADCNNTDVYMNSFLDVKSSSITYFNKNKSIIFCVYD